MQEKKLGVTMLLFQPYKTIDHFGVIFIHVCRHSNELSDSERTTDFHSKISPGNAATKPQDPAKTNGKVTLVIGDSMVKNINSKKIERATGHRSVCH